MKCGEYSKWDHIPNTTFSTNLYMSSNKQEHYIALDGKGLPGTNNLAFGAHLKLTEKIKWRESYLQHIIFFQT
jgi:hypothetical protein